MECYLRIEKDIPLPDSRLATRYPWADMEIGDSFFVAGGDQTQIASAMNSNEKSTGRRYVSARTFKEDAEYRRIYGVRVWRIE